ncbi:MAG: 50S ribosomal protein L35, partial [Peptococcia bacterium]
AAKRFSLTGTGKIKRSRAYTSHILTKKSPKRKRNLRKAAIMHKGDAQRVINLIPYK